MTDSLYFDTDCLSSFLWVKAEKILTALYSNRIIIPQQVYNELSNPVITHLRMRLDSLINKGGAVIQPILADSPEYSLYMKLTNAPDDGYAIIGKGEAAAITLAYVSGGAVASNNMKDVSTYVSRFNLRHVTTGDILARAFERSLITEDKGNRIWDAMLARKRKIGAASFTNYLRKHND